MNGASPLQLIIMLYDGAMKSMEAGKHAIVNHDLEKQNKHLLHAQKIVMELMSCLDMKEGGDIAANLLSLYTYVLNQLVDANVQDDEKAVDRAIQVLSELRESWAKVEEGMKSPIDEKLAS